MFSRFGARVTILERGESILSRYEPEIAASIAESFRDQDIAIYTDANVIGVAGDQSAVSVSVQMGGSPRDFKAARLLVATGRKPNTDGLSLNKAQVELDQLGFVKVDEELRTSADHIYAAGVVIGSYTGSQMVTPIGAQDGGIAAENALTSARRKVNHAIVPRAIFTGPQVAVVGLTDEEANAQVARVSAVPFRCLWSHVQVRCVRPVAL